MLGGLVGGCREVSPRGPLRTQSGGNEGERMQGDGNLPVKRWGLWLLLGCLNIFAMKVCSRMPLYLLASPCPSPNTRTHFTPQRTTNSAGGLAFLPVSFAYVNDNPQEVSVGERRELASLDLLNHFITGTSFEWPSSAGWPAPPLSHLSDHKEIKISPSLEMDWTVCPTLGGLE